MIKGNLQEMVKGWFVGDFSPVFLRSADFEVAVKTYKAGEREEAHFHRVASEITVIVTGEVVMNGLTYKKNDMLLIEPSETFDFLAVTDVITVVVKVPSVKNDKFPAEN